MGSLGLTAVRLNVRYGASHLGEVLITELRLNGSTVMLVMELLNSNLLVVTRPKVDLLGLQEQFVVLRVHWSTNHLSSSSRDMLKSIAVETVTHMARCGLRSNRVVHVGRLAVWVAHLELSGCHPCREVLATLGSCC